MEERRIWRILCGFCECNREIEGEIESERGKEKESEVREKLKGNRHK
jgi:hypothetical protein